MWCTAHTSTQRRSNWGEKRITVFSQATRTMKPEILHLYLSKSHCRKRNGWKSQRRRNRNPRKLGESFLDAPAYLLWCRPCNDAECGWRYIRKGTESVWAYGSWSTETSRFPRCTHVRMINRFGCICVCINDFKCRCVKSMTMRRETNILTYY